MKYDPKDYFTAVLDELTELSKMSDKKLEDLMTKESQFLSSSYKQNYSPSYTAKEFKKKFIKENKFQSVKNMLLLNEDIDMTEIQLGDDIYEIGFDNGNLVVATGENKVCISNDMLSLMNTIKDIIGKEYEVPTQNGADTIVNKMLNGTI